MKGLAKAHVCVTHRHRQQCGDGQREGGMVGLGGGEPRMGWGHGDICSSVNNKNKKCVFSFYFYFLKSFFIRKTVKDRELECI